MKISYIILIILIGILLYYETKHYSTTNQIAKFDNKKYIVRNEDDKQEAAELLALMKNKSNKLIQGLIRDYPSNKNIIKLNMKFKTTDIYETTYKKNYTSYSLNKGDAIYLCLRNINNNLHNENTIFFVMMHELAHIMTDDWEHSPEFWKNFKLLTSNAIKYNLYNYINYNKYPQSYCGIKINTTP